MRARYLVAADGLHSGIRSAVGLSRAGARPARYGLRRHFAVAPWTDLVEVHWSPAQRGLRHPGRRRTWWGSPS